MPIRLLILSTLLVLISCAEGGSGKSTAFSNKFTARGVGLNIDSITSASFLGSTAYYGRVLFKSGGSLYGGSFHFNLVKNDSTTAYFSGFFLDRLVLFLGINSVVPIVTSSIDLSVGSTYSSSSNAFNITNITDRYVGFNLDFGNNTGITSDVINAAAVFTSDLTTFVGGDNSTFFFIAQKASSMSSVAVNDFKSPWYMIDFSVSGFGRLTLRDFSKLEVSGSGGLGFNSFKGYNVFNNSVVYAGEFNITDSGTGASGMSFDNTPNGGDPIEGNGAVDGAFLMSPNKDFILGFDSRNNYYFAGSR